MYEAILEDERVVEVNLQYRMAGIDVAQGLEGFQEHAFLWYPSLEGDFTNVLESPLLTNVNARQCLTKSRRSYGSCLNTSADLSLTT